MISINFAYRPGLLAATNRKYRVDKIADGQWTIYLDASLKGTSEVAGLLRKASDEIDKQEGVPHGN